MLLKDEIDMIRDKLYEILRNGSREEINSVSQQLDELLVRFYRESI